MGRSKAQILSELKSMPLANDQYRSLAMGMRDPRHRRGPQATSVTGQRYNQGEFRVDEDGRLNLRRHGIEASKLRDGGGGGTVVIPATTRVVNCEHRLSAVTGVNSQQDFGNALQTPPTVTSNTPRIVGLTATNGHWIIYRCPLPLDGDLTAEWSAAVGLQKSGTTLTFTLDIYVFGAAAGDDFEGSGGVVTETAFLQISDTMAAYENGQYAGRYAATIPANTFTSDMVAIWFVIATSAITVQTTGSICIPDMWLEYQTAAATITVT